MRAIVLIAVIAVSGCSQTFKGLFTLRSVGVNDQGFAVAAVYCEQAE